MPCYNLQNQSLQPYLMPEANITNESQSINFHRAP